MTIPRLDDYLPKTPSASQRGVSSLPTLDDYEEKKPPGFFASTYNIGKHIFELAGIGDPEKVQATRGIVAQRMGEGVDFESQVGNKVVSDISNMFSNVTWDSTKRTLGGVKDEFLDNPIGFTGKTLVGIPLGLLNMVATPLKYQLGVDFTQDEARLNSVEEQAKLFKETLGTAAGLLLTKGVGRMTGAIRGAALSAETGGASTAELLAISERAGQGELGRKLVDHTLSGVAFGSSQAAIANAGQDDVAAQIALQGIAFAPIGAAVGLFSDAIHPSVDPITARRLQAGDVAKTRQLQLLNEKSLDEVVNNVAATVQSDNILEAVARGNLKTNPDAINIIRGVTKEDIGTMNPEGLLTSVYKRSDGLNDVMIIDKANTIFKGRELVSDPIGKAVDRVKDENGNFIGQVGDHVLKANDDGSFVRGILTIRNGDFWVRPLAMQDNAEGFFGEQVTPLKGTAPLETPKVQSDIVEPVNKDKLNREVNAAAPAWLKENLTKYTAVAEQRGVVGAIADLSAQRLTAEQIRQKLESKLTGHDRLEQLNIIRATRNKLKIPSMDDKVEFENWIKSRNPISSTVKPTKSTQGTYEKYDPESWYVDPNMLNQNTAVDFGKIQAADKATFSERQFAATLFQRTGDLPKVGTISNARELVGYNGQDFYVDKINNDGTVDLMSPHKKVDGAIGRITVKTDEVRLRDAQVHEFNSSDYYDGLYNSTRPSLGTKPFAEVLGEVAIKNQLNGPQTRALKVELANRYAKELALQVDPTERMQFAKNLAEINQHMQQEQVRVMEDMAEHNRHLLHTANSNGMFIEDDGVGFNLRNLETNEVMWRGNNASEAIKWINASGQAVSAELDATSPIPTEAVAGGVPPVMMAQPGIRQTMNDVVAASNKSDNILNRLRVKLQKFDVGTPWLSNMHAFITGMDEAYGTKLLHQYERIQTAQAQFEAAAGTEFTKYRQLFKDVRSLVKSPERMELIARGRETLSADEIKNSLFRDRPLSNAEVNTGKFIADNHIDETKVLRFRTEYKKILLQMQAKVSETFGNSMEELLKQAQTPEQEVALKETFKSARKQVAAQFQPMFTQLKERYGLSKDEGELFQKLNLIANDKLSEVSIYGAVRYGRALKNPEVDGLSRGEYIIKHGLTPAEVNVMNRVDGFYEEMASKFGISESRRINGFMNHMKIIGDEIDPKDFTRFTSHLENPNAARFMSDMTRTGEVTDYNHDLVEAMRGYIRGGYKAKILFPEIHGKGSPGNFYQGVKQILEQDITRNVNIPQTAKDQIFSRMREYIESATGRQPVNDVVMKEAGSHALSKMGIDVSTDKVNTGSKVSTLLQTMNAAFTGGKLYQGARDATDISSKYYMMFGARRAGSFIKQGVVIKDMPELIKKGIVRVVNKDSFTQPLETGVFTDPVGKGKQALNTFNDALFKMTLQSNVFAHAQASAYLESRSFGRQIFNDVLDKKIDAKSMVDKLSLRRFENNVTDEIGRLLEVHGTEAASEYYGKVVAKNVVGWFGNGEQPTGFNTKAGKLVGAYGMYPIEQRRFIQNLLTRGTPQEIAGAATRWGVSQGALLLTGKALGFDVGRWVYTPASAIFSGGPLVGIANTVGTATTASLQDDKKQQFAYNNLKALFPSLNDPRSPFVPGSYFAHDLMKGYDLLNQGDWRGIIQGAGVPASQDESMFDSGEITSPYMVRKSFEDMMKKNGF